MKQDDTSIGAFFKSLFGKVETGVPTDTPDDSDAEYYRMDTKTVKRAESTFTADDTAEAHSEPVKKAEYTAPQTTVADVDDFDFVDDGAIDDEIKEGYGTEFTNASDDVCDLQESDEDVIDAKVKYIKNATLADATEVADAIIDGAFTVIDIANTSVEEKTRMFDFISGVVYACGGRVEKMQGGKCVLVLPEGMDMDDFKAAMAAMENDR